MTSVPSGETGLCWWHEPGHDPVFLVVDRSRVVDCTPHAKSWALNQASGPLLERGERLGVRVEWIALKSVPKRVQTHLTPHTRLRRWRSEGYAGVTRTLTFATTDGGYLLDDGAEKHAWVFTDREDCLNELRRRLGGGEWSRIYANAGECDPEMPDEWGVPG